MAENGNDRWQATWLHFRKPAKPAAPIPPDTETERRMASPGVITHL